MPARDYITIETFILATQRVIGMKGLTTLDVVALCDCFGLPVQTMLRELASRCIIRGIMSIEAQELLARTTLKKVRLMPEYELCRQEMLSIISAI